MRGDGTTGEDITHNAGHHHDHPAALSRNLPEEVEVRGEVFISSRTSAR
ncbi:hypothetical protein QJS66_07350 [Kocuria rhizophila]|nr:hypothetical protein QJS66_07350 [Kocuria rhizophila]